MGKDFTYSEMDDASKLSRIKQLGAPHVKSFNWFLSQGIEEAIKMSEDHMEDHVSWAKSNSRGLVTTPIKDEIVKETAHRLAELGPEKAILERRKFMKHIRKRAKALRGAADARLARLPKHIQRVLSACGRNKVNIPLLEELGREFYPEE